MRSAIRKPQIHTYLVSSGKELQFSGVQKRFLHGGTTSNMSIAWSLVLRLSHRHDKSKSACWDHFLAFKVEKKYCSKLFLYWPKDHV